MAEAVAYAISYIATGTTAAYAAYMGYAYVVVVAATVAYSGYASRKAESRARAAANASAKDREVMIRSAIAPRRIVYGRDRISGPIVYMESTGDKSQYLHMVVALAAHECDAIEKVYFNEIELPEPDGDGWITSGEFAKGSTTESGVHTGTTDGSGAITLPHDAVAITAAYTEIGVGEAATQTHHTGYSHTEGSDTITGLPADTSVTIGYTYTQAGTPLVRVRKYLGTADQTACADLVAESAGQWTSNHRGRGVCYLYVRLEYDQDVFGSVGVPNISAVVRGKQVYDPRTTTTAWSNNAALCVADYLRSDEGMRADTAEVPDSEIIAAANICDEEIDLSLDDEDVQARYTCDLSFTTERSPRDVLSELLACMSGRAVWTQGRWLVRPGAYRTPTLTITADMLAGPVSVMPKASRSELFNAVRATYRDATSFAELQAPLVKNSGYEAEDGGVRIVRQIDVPTLADTYRAQRLAKIELERARQALTVKLTCNLKAYDLAPTDTVLLTLATYGWSAKPFEVLERTLTREGTIQYTLRETAAGVYDWAWGEATVGDLAPDTNLPNPFGLPAVLQNLAVDEDAIRLADGTIITQAVVTWDASESPFVANGGSIQYQTAKVGTPWGTGSLPGDATTVTLGPLQVGVAYVFRARAINASGRAGDWAYIGLVAEGLAAPPDDVTGLDYEIKPGQVWITWDPCEEADYAATELRYDGTGWADATFLWRGAGSDYQHPRPPNGTYTVRAKHIDTSGTYSTNAASISVTVDDSIDPGLGGSLQLTSDRFPFFAFADGTTHTAQAPGDADIVFTVALIGLAGTPTITAEAFDASSASLGAITLTGSGLTRTMTAAAFVAPGSSGSVRYAVVTATLAGASDTLTVYRQDSTTTAPRLYLSNPTHTVATDEAGEGGDYSGATTDVEVYVGLTNDTSNWSFAITPDAGVTATINGGAGPVTGTASVEVAVSAMTVPDGAVLITASKTAETDLTGSFAVTKNEGGNGAQVYWDPRSEIVLPVGAGGEVSSFADAYSSLVIQRASGQSDVANWTYSIDELVNVTATLTGNRVDVTAMASLGATGTSTDVTLNIAAAGWTGLLGTYYGGGLFMATGINVTPTAYDYVYTSPDFATWTLVNVGATGHWRYAAHDEETGAWCVLERTTGGNRVRRSLNGGASWSGVTLPGGGLWYDMAAGNGRIIITDQSSTGGYRSTDGGATWSAITLPADSMKVFPGADGVWLGFDASSQNYISRDHGSTWATLNDLPAPIQSACEFRGRTIITVSGASTKVWTIQGNSGSLAQSTLPASRTSAEVIVVQDVLYVVGNGALQYSTDGLAYRAASSATMPASSVPVMRTSQSLGTDFVPTFNVGSSLAARTPLLATSDSVGAVVVRATQTGQVDIVRTLPVRKSGAEGDVLAFSASPYSLALPATSDGVVTSFDGATITAVAELNGANDTANWTWNWTATYLTPSSGSSNVATFTGMDQAETVGQVTFRASRAGYRDVVGTVEVRKVLGTESSGPRIGSAYSVVETANTFIGVRFNTDGSVDVKRGSGGSYTRLTQWAGAVVAGVGSSYWLYVAPRAGTHALSAGTEDAWLALSSARSFEMTDAGSGVHTYEADVYIGTSSSGANAVAGFFSMRLIVP